MFETATLSYGSSGKRVWTTAMGFTGQALLVACALLAPMISPQVLPRVTWITSIAPPGAPPPPLPPGERVVTRNSVRVSQFHEGKLFIPTKIPPKPLILTEEEAPIFSSGPGVPGGVQNGPIGGDPNGLIGGIINEAAHFMPPIRPPAAVREAMTKTAATTAAPPRITTIRMASPIHRVEPIYPALAKQARVSGVVELLGVLGTDGRIHELKVLRGHPLLVNAAIEAVRQWIYEPTLLNGQAVEVSAPITVNFILK
jgi:protein TonB